MKELGVGDALAAGRLAFFGRRADVFLLVVEGVVDELELDRDDLVAPLLLPLVPNVAFEVPRSVNSLLVGIHVEGIRPARAFAEDEAGNEVPFVDDLRLYHAIRSQLLKNEIAVANTSGTAHKLRTQLCFAASEVFKWFERIAIQNGLRLVGVGVAGDGKVLVAKVPLLGEDGGVRHIFCDLGTILFEMSTSFFRSTKRMRVVAAGTTFGKGSV